MKKLLFILVGLFISGMLFLSSCHRDDEDQPEENQDTTKTVLNEESSSNATYSAEIYSQVVANVLVKTDENDEGKSQGLKDGTCPEVSLQPLVGYPKTLTIDYGTGCSLQDHTFKGSITAQISDRLRKAGTTVSISFNSFSVDTITINGTISLTVDSVNLTKQIVYLTMSLTDASLTMPRGTVSMDGSFNVVWYINQITDYTDDEIHFLSGQFTAVNIQGKQFEATITETLVYPVSCGKITQGKLHVETSEIPYPADVDFGDGTCDNTAQVCTKIEKTIGGHTFYEDYCYTIQLPY